MDHRIALLSTIELHVLTCGLGMPAPQSRPSYDVLGLFLDISMALLLPHFLNEMLPSQTPDETRPIHPHSTSAPHGCFPSPALHSSAPSLI